MQKSEQFAKKLERTQYDALVYLESVKDNKKSTQRTIAEYTHRSIGLINSTIQELQKLDYVNDGKITALGIKALEPYKVKRAIFLAAGIGERLIPITLNTPKPLVRVRGTRLIDTTLDAVVAAGIDDIIIIRGYLSEQFDQLLYKYPGLKFVENPIYMESNNISSLMCVRHCLQNTYIFDADIFLNNRSLVTKYQYSSNYLGIPVDVTDDWVIESKNGFITGARIGGKNCHKVAGISYWTEDDGLRMAEHIGQVFDKPGGKEFFWDQALFDFYTGLFKVEIRECSSEDVVEIDTFNQLKQLDKAYK